MVMNPQIEFHVTAAATPHVRRYGRQPAQEGGPLAG